MTKIIKMTIEIAATLKNDSEDAIEDAVDSLDVTIDNADVEILSSKIISC